MITVTVKHTTRHTVQFVTIAQSVETVSDIDGTSIKDNIVSVMERATVQLSEHIANGVLTEDAICEIVVR